MYAAEINVHLLKVLRRFTAVSEPADVSWGRPLKSRLRELWTQDVAEQLRQHGHDPPSFKLKVTDRSKIVWWICSSWSSISADCISSGFRGAHIPSQPLESVGSGSWLHLRSHCALTALSAPIWTCPTKKSRCVWVGGADKYYKTSLNCSLL